MVHYKLLIVLTNSQRASTNKYGEVDAAKPGCVCLKNL